MKSPLLQVEGESGSAVSAQEGPAGGIVDGPHCTPSLQAPRPATVRHAEGPTERPGERGREGVDQGRPARPR